MKDFVPFKRAVPILLSLMVIMGCSDDDDMASHDFTGSWKVAYYLEGNQKVTKEDRPTWPDINDGDITAIFTEPNHEGRGTVSGTSVTNAYNANYTLEKSGAMTIDPITTTLINQPDWTDLYHLSGAKTFEVKGSNLFLSAMGENLVIVFEPN